MGDNRQTNCSLSNSNKSEESTAQQAEPAPAGDPLDLLLEQKKKLEQLNTWFGIALNNMVRGLSMFDAERRLVVCNNSYRQMYDLPEELTAPGTPLAEIVRFHVRRESGRDGPEEAEQQAKWIDEHMEKLAKGQSFSRVQNLRDGRKFLVTYQPLADGGWVDIQEDVTEKRRAEEKIEWLARHDALTGVANRFHFRETFEARLNELNGGSALALHWLDLDRFKEVNDTFGHPIGDALLKAVAQRLRGSVRKSDFLARLGGDEFAIIQAGAHSTEQCERLARRVLQEVSKPYHIYGNAISISASIGIVRAPINGRTADELLKNADVALYSVKSVGRRGFELFHSNAGRRVDNQRRLESDIRGALADNQFELHYQPILSLHSRHVVACEALLRWRHPREGLVAPQDFLPLAERTGAILDIGRWALGQACLDAARWKDDIRVSVNLSPLQLDGTGLAGAVDQALSMARLKPLRLQLEIGEAMIDNGVSRMRETLGELHKIGVSIALDDFGRSSASLNNLSTCCFDEVKIDRSLIKEAPTCEDVGSVVHAVAALAKALGMRSTAEGVETLEELNAAARAGCRKVQGYYFSRPVPAAELEAVLSECPHKLALAA